ncbi:S-phase kinase-associated protein 1 [Orchesella cincta]|uniref:S-phase kinase-associated protein 1 n=1 Tax=Orchesella cincta TaxID=48709 RepID=A0A1D2M9L4_ORCCI|nr:S-phase kinase-associated protein 1 [Orchesella cincta]
MSGYHFITFDELPSEAGYLDLVGFELPFCFPPLLPSRISKYKTSAIVWKPSSELRTMSKIQLRTHDGEDFDVEKKILRYSATIVGMDILDQNEGQAEASNGKRIVLQVDAKVFRLVIEWATHHHESECEGTGACKETPENKVEEWDTDFLKKLDSDTLFQLMQGANYLDVKELSQILYKTVANILKGKTPEEIRKFVNLAVIQPTPDDDEKAVMNGPYVKLQSSDGMNKAVTLRTAKSIPVVSELMGNAGKRGLRSNGQVIKLPNVNYNALTDVLDWLKQQDEKIDDDDNWKEDFLDAMDQVTLLELLLASKDLGLEDLLTLTCQKVAKMVNEHTPEEIRKMMGIKDDLSAEDKAIIQKQNDWVIPPPSPNPAD